MLIRHCTGNTSVSSTRFPDSDVDPPTLARAFGNYPTALLVQPALSVVFKNNCQLFDGIALDPTHLLFYLPEDPPEQLLLTYSTDIRLCHLRPCSF
ncbi:hypothetical protein A3Q56_03724 [Intoshia linei]|uniref:Uncharacterized protein n=1 Tax=Intoshia linei TaxID=1819745 RepID=A0A177B2U5_9BILA|nr:hypothetical protein A3Q56_03724 [Intoshia linei]